VLPLLVFRDLAVRVRLLIKSGTTATNAMAAAADAR
jgi:hypothetical protein